MRFNLIKKIYLRVFLCEIIHTKNGQYAPSTVPSTILSTRSISKLTIHRPDGILAELQKEIIFIKFSNLYLYIVHDVPKLVHDNLNNNN